MTLLDKLLFSRKSFKRRAENLVPLSIGIGANDRNPLTFGADQVRILLFQECEWRGRKLLFDSIAIEKSQAKSPSGTLKNGTEQKSETNTEVADGFVYEHEKVAHDDINLLSEMVFGTVAMTYRGPSFKVHAIDSPRCIMCTKVFPAPDHTAYKSSERYSDEALGRSFNADSNSSNGSIRTLLSRPSSANSTGNELSPELRKSSTCSSTGSFWDMDVPLLPDSSQSLESNGSSGVGSLTSLRRRWLRAVSTSLSHSESEDIFGFQHSNDTANDVEARARRHKTRLGLAMLVQLTQGYERQMETRLLEHVALLEGLLDRLRCCCFETSKKHARSKCNGLVARMHRASARCTFWLLRLLVDSANLPAPLLWHEVLLNSTISTEERVNTLYYSLQQMCRLLDDVDTKSTNFFLSTVVTAVLTYHLGWVHTVLSSRDRQMVETLGKRYPCNPLWAQLGDLYGALGNPSRLVHTVIAGDTEKVDQINDVLIFLSYFIRSAIVERCRERRCDSEQDAREATDLLEQLYKKRLSFASGYGRSGRDSPGSLSPGRESPNSSRPRRKTSKRRVELPNGDANSSLHAASRWKHDDAKVSKMKRSSTVQKNLNAYVLSPPKLPFNSGKLCSGGVDDDDDDESAKPFPVNGEEEAAKNKSCDSNKVKIIVSESAPREFSVTKESLQRRSPLRDFERKLEATDSDELLLEAKLASLQRRTAANGYDLGKSHSGGFDEVDALGAGLTFENKEPQVLFTLGAEEKSVKSLSGLQLGGCNCQCSFAFTRVPSTSAQLPEDILRKIIQRNFPESSKNIQPLPGSSSKVGAVRFCEKCNGSGNTLPLNYEGNKLLLETPTNATEVLRTCGNSSVDGRGIRIDRSNSLEALMEENGVVELPMPRSRKVTTARRDAQNGIAGFSNTILCGKVKRVDGEAEAFDTGYTWGLAIQGFIKKKKKRRKRKSDKSVDDEDEDEDEANKEWWWSMREEVGIGARFPVVDQPVAEALCIIADLDTWQVGILSNNRPLQHPPLPVGMSRLVSNMLEAFAYVWRKYRSPRHCVKVLEGKLREMWLRSEALAELLMAADERDAKVTALTTALDLDAADLPLLFAVATTHSPQLAQRFGLSLA